jgi:AbrB family looped-hinge helix DNA binding protein
MQAVREFLGIRDERVENLGRCGRAKSKPNLTNQVPNGNLNAMIVTLDKMNRLVVPKLLRDRMGLKSGDEMELTLEADGIRLRPAVTQASFTEVDGILICASEVPTSAWDLVAFMNQQREERSIQLGGL